MSSDSEMEKDEVKVIQQKKSLKEVLKKHWPIGIKILELLLCATCMGFIYEPASMTGLGKSHFIHVGMMYTAYTGYMVINCVLILSKAMKKKVPYTTVAVFALVGSALFMITCILLFVDRLYLMKHYFYQPNMHLQVLMTTAIVFTLINVFVFGADGILTIVMKNDF